MKSDRNSWDAIVIGSWCTGANTRFRDSSRLDFSEAAGRHGQHRVTTSPFLTSLILSSRMSTDGTAIMRFEAMTGRKRHPIDRLEAAFPVLHVIIG
jgi:hypothetical protein